MAKSYSQIDTASGTFAGWLSQSNDLFDDMSNVIVTTAAVSLANGTNGSQTTGNSHILGIFSANTIVVGDALRGGDATDAFSNTQTLIIASNTEIGNSTVADTLTVYGTVNAQANVVIGSASSDRISFNAVIDTTFLPRTDANTLLTIGSTSNRWGKLYSDEIYANGVFSLVDDNPTFTIVDTTATAAAGPTIDLYRNSASPDTNDVLSTLNFTGKDDGGNKTTYARIETTLEDPTDTEEDGSVKIYSTVAGTERLLIDMNESAAGDVRLYFANSTATDVKLTTKTDGVDITGELQSDSLDVDGNGDISGNLAIGGNLTVTGDATISGNLTFGDAATDSISLGADIHSDIIPNANNSYNLGSTTQRWEDLYVDDIIAATATFSSTVDITGAVGIDGNFDVATNKFTVNATSGNSTVGGTLGVTGAITITDTTASTSSTTGSLVVGGGAGIADDLYVGADLDVVGSVTVGGDLDVVGTFTLPSSTSLTLNAADSVTSTVSSLLSVTGNTDIGNATSDTVTINASVDSDVLPYANNTYDLGSTNFRWAEVHANNVLSTNATIATLVTTTFTAGGTATFNGNVDLGNADSDTVTYTARVDSAIVPSANNTYDLGTTALVWNEIHVANVNAEVAVNTPLVAVENQGDVRFYEGAASGSNYIAIQAPATLAADYTFTLPSNDGDASQFLQTDGSGGLSWQTVDTTLTLDGSSGTTDISLLNKEFAVLGSLGVTTAVTSNTTHGILTVSTPQDLRTSASPTFAGLSSLTGNITFSGSQTVDGRDVSADGAKLDGIESGATADQTASEILTLIKTVDGAGSGLDADLLDGVTSGSFLRSDAADIKDAGDLTFNDNISALFGTSGDLQIVHDGTNSYIEEQGTGDLYIQSTGGDIFLRTSTSENALWADQDGAVTLYHNAAAKLATSASGVSITGTATATTFSGALSGNASTATALATGRTIALSGDVAATGVSFDGTGNITLATTIQPNSVALGTDTTGNYVAAGATSGIGLSGSVSSEGGTFTVTSNATSSNTASTIIARDASGNFSAGTFTGAWAYCPAGTTMLFRQTSAPTGWTKDTTNYNNSAIRVVTGTASQFTTGVSFTDAFKSWSVSATAAGNVSVSVANGGPTNTGSTTLTSSQMPSHTHSYTITNNGNRGTLIAKGGNGLINISQAGANTGATGGGTGHTHSISTHSHNANANFTGSSHSHSFALNVNYIDVIVATKN